MATISLVIDDIRTFLAQPRTKPFMNERDLQMHLALFLTATNHYNRVEVEYYVPKIALGSGYVWKNEMKVDIVIEKSGEYIPIELKYKTREIPGINIDRFGEVLKGVQIVKNQSAQNEAKYAFWKDVRRIELLKKRFPSAIKNGVVLFLTNDYSYQMPQKLMDAKSASHSVAEGSHFNERSALKESMPAFMLFNSYTIKWSGKLDKINPTIFEYILLKI